MNLRERLRPQRVKLMLIIALIYSLSLGTIIAEQSAEASGKDAVFTDIQSGSEYEEALTSLIEQKIIYGYADGTYRPSEHLNREQAAVILARALRLNLEVTARPKFTDVNENSAVYKSIAAVVNAGIFQGYSDGTFKPNQSLTRAEMAKILVVSYQFPVEELVDNPFKDVPSTSWYAPYLTSLIQNKITTGTSLTTYSPNEAVNRGEMALFIYRCQQLEQQLTERIIESEVATITSNSVQLGSESFTLTADLKTWMTPENFPLLKSSRVKAYIIGGTISRIESVTLYADGPLDDKKKNSYAVLTGNGAVIDATVIIKGDNLSIKDATLAKDLIIENDVQNSFYVENVRVKGSTILAKPQEIVATKLSNSFASVDIKNNNRPQVHFHNSILQSIKVSLDGVTIRLTGESKVNETDLLVDAYLEADTNITIPMVRVGTEALSTVLNAVIDSLFVENTNSRITLNNDAKIEDLRLKLKDDVNLIFLDYELIKHKIIRINGELNTDQQPSTGGSSNAGQNSHVIAAKNAVAGLFMDSTKTALKVGVDQAAIDDAKGKVELVADGAEKSALVADLQVAQQLLNTQLEAIANLQAATKAVNALFADNTKTALKAGVDQAVIDDAKAKVELVADGIEKSALVADLQAAQQLLTAQLEESEAIALLQATTKAVNALFADSTKTALMAGVDQDAIDEANAKVNLVADGVPKSALVADLQAAQQLLNAQLEAIALLQEATEAVNGLFSDNTKTSLKTGIDQATIDDAKTKIALVAEGAEKSSLLADLHVAQQLLNDQIGAIAKLQAAIEAVNALFMDGTKTALKSSVNQNTIDEAKDKVNLVADGTEKSALVADLQIAQQLLNAQIDATAKLQAATEAVNALFTDGTKTALKVGLNQGAIDAAKNKVDLVADGTEKSVLVVDLQIAQQLLNDQLEASAKLQAATEAVNALFSDSTKTALKAGVNQGTIDAAKDRVDLMADGTEKSALAADLQIAQQLLNDQIDTTAKLQAATEAVNALFTDGTKTALKVGVDQNAIDAAKAKVNLVADGTEKSALVADLQSAQQLLNDQIDATAKLQAATEAVNALFTDGTKTALKTGVDQDAIDTTNTKVNLVTDGIEKSMLLADLQLAQQLLNYQLEAIANLQAATEAVNALFTDRTKTALKAGVNQGAIDAAKAKVNLVADGAEKSVLAADLQIAQQLLNDQIDAIAKLQAATEAVNALFTDSTKTALKAGVNQGAIDAAKNKVDLVADGTEKSVLVADLQTAQQLLNDQIDAIAKLQAATEAVNALFTDSTKTALKASVDQNAIDAAKDKVNLVADGTEKSVLVADLQNAQQLLNDQIDATAKLQAATEAVNALFADNTKTALKAGVNQGTIDAAKAKVNLVADGAEKSALAADLQIAQQLLNDQIDAIAKLQAATEAVNALFSDGTKTALKASVNQNAIDAAKDKVNLVADGAEKSALVADLQIAQQLLNDQIDAIAKLQAATEAVNALFSDSTKTALKAGVNQGDIDAAKAKVNLVADGTEKSVLVADLQNAQQLLNDQIDAIVKLQAATEAVNALFTDGTKTALKSDVDQNTIDAAKAKVNLVADGTEKSVLVADLQNAQQLLNDQIDAIAKLQAATEAVNALFTDGTKTALKAGVDQAAINNAKAKVALVADGAEKLALEQAIGIAQDLLNYVLDAPTLTGTAPNIDTVRITFDDDEVWRDKITGIYLNGNSTPIHSSRVDKANAGVIEINLSGASLKPGAHEFLIKAEGFADAVVTIVVDPPLAAPTLTGTAPNVDTVRITFDDDAVWRDKITGIYLNDNSTPIHSTRVDRANAGVIEINLSGASLKPGAHEFLIKSEGYADAVVTIVVDPPLAAPTLTGTAPNVDTVRITFDDDAAWRNKITGVYLNDNSTPIHSTRVDRANAGVIEINLSGASLRPGTHKFLIKSEGYADAVVTIVVDPPLAAPGLTGSAPNPETVRITFADDAVWRSKITGVYLAGNSVPVHSSRVNTSSEGRIEIDFTEASLTPGTHQFLIKADGYEDVMVVIFIGS